VVVNTGRELVLFDTGNGGDPSSSAAVVSWQSTSYRLRWIA
jgi:hypothetical protein